MSTPIIDNIPQYADGDAIRRVIKHGTDVSKPIKVDFFVALHCIADAESMAKLATENGYTTEVEVDPEFNSFTCNCTKEILLTHENVTSIQAQLDRLAEPFDGWSDGWGTFGDSSS